MAIPVNPADLPVAVAKRIPWWKDKRLGLPVWGWGAVGAGFSLLFLAVIIGGSGTASLTRPQTDMNELIGWCEKTGDEIQTTYYRNPIRGDELKANYLRELTHKILNKEVAWQFRVAGINPQQRGIVVDSAFGWFHPNLAALYVRTGNMMYGVNSLIPVSGVGLERLRSLSVDDWVTLTGTVGEITCDRATYPQRVRGVVVPLPAYVWIVKLDGVRLK
jgi:hypothetical protein